MSFDKDAARGILQRWLPGEWTPAFHLAAALDRIDELEAALRRARPVVMDWCLPNHGVQAVLDEIDRALEGS